jgi:hypothetical protein
MLSFLRSLIHPSLLGYEHPIPYITISNLEHVCPSCDDHATMHVY